MQSNFARAAIALGAIAVVVVLFVVLQGGGDDDESPVAPATRTTDTNGDAGSRDGGDEAGEGAGTESGQQQTQRERPPQPATIVVRGGQPVGGVRRLEFEKGDRVRFVVRSDVADEIHVHGYDRTDYVQAGGQARFDFEATLEGVFEVELESRHVQIAELRVEPS